MKNFYDMLQILKESSGDMLRVDVYIEDPDDIYETFYIDVDDQEELDQRINAYEKMLKTKVKYKTSIEKGDPGYF